MTTIEELKYAHLGGNLSIPYAEAVPNIYKHEECGSHWADLWSCGCNDECPKCGAEIEPYFSEAVQGIDQES